MMTHLDYLRQFHEIGESEYQLLAEKLRPRSWKKGDNMVVPGQTQRELYVVKKGVQMSYFESEKKLHVIAFTYPPDFCSIPESFTLQQPSDYFLTCLTDSELDYITFDDLQELFEKSRGIERLFRKMTELVLAGILSRHRELHSRSIEDRYKSFCQRSPHLLQMVPHKYLASYLGIDPTNFSKLFNTVKF